MKTTTPEILVRRSLTFPGFKVTEVHYPGSFRQPSHAHDTTGITLIISGRLEERVGHACEQASACSVVVKPAGVEHCNWYGADGATTLAFELEPRFLAELDVQRGLGQWRWWHCGPAARTLIGMLRAVRSDPDGPTGVLEEALFELLSLLADDENEREPTGIPPDWLEHAKEELHRRRNAAFRVRDTAAVVGVHPVYLTRQFQRYYGCSATAYLAQLRLREAARLVTSSDISFSNVAHQSGFTDQSHLCRTFKAGLGVTPKTYRRLATN